MPDAIKEQPILTDILYGNMVRMMPIITKASDTIIAYGLIFLFKTTHPLKLSKNINHKICFRL